MPSVDQHVGGCCTVWAIDAPTLHGGSPRRWVDGELHLAPFETFQAATIARWARTTQELWWLAPNTAPPLTSAKVVAWQKEGGSSFVLVGERGDAPVAYGELNPMRDTADHLWIGHAVVRPDQRGRGVGRFFLTRLLGEAFGPMSAAHVSLIVFPDNESAIRCYTAVGFAIVGEEHHQFGGAGPQHRLLRLSTDRCSFERRRLGRGVTPCG